MLLPLSDYYSGPLLYYSLALRDKEGKELFNEDLRSLINISDSFRVLASDEMREDTFQMQREPFPRSTVFLKEYTH